MGGISEDSVVRITQNQAASLFSVRVLCPQVCGDSVLDVAYLCVCVCACASVCVSGVVVFVGMHVCMPHRV